MNRTKPLISFFCIVFAVIIQACPVIALEKPELMLAKIFHPYVDVTKYWVSEKLDGVRARWDGDKLVSRGGSIFNPPDWFVQGFPDELLDGELWIARGEYQQTVSIVRKKIAHEGWRKVKFMAFDLPLHSGNFSSRVSTMRQLKQSIKSPYFNFIRQYRVTSKKQLMQNLRKIIEWGGEGLMLHHQQSLYQSGRSNDLLKLKPYQDAEAVVIGYRPGKGQFSGKMGAIKVKIDNGRKFYIGSGFSHKERENPPVINSVVTFRYQGFTNKGIPRFAVFLRVRDEP
jgi:DNA ligase-1